MLKSDIIKKKRGRPKKESSPKTREDEDNDFKPPLSRLIKRKNLLDNYEDLPEPAEPLRTESKIESSTEAFGDFKISKKSKVRKLAEEARNETANENNGKNGGRNKIKHSLEEMKIHKIFTEILNLSYQEEDTLMIISNILSAGRKALGEKMANIKKKKNILKGSNLSQQEYMKKEKEIERAENEEIREVKEDIFNKLCASKILGFETKEMILSNLRKNYKRLAEDHPEGGTPENEIEFDIKESEFEKLKTDQIALIEKLLNEDLFMVNDIKSSKEPKSFQRPNHANPVIPHASSGAGSFQHAGHHTGGANAGVLHHSGLSNGFHGFHGFHEEGTRAEGRMSSLLENDNHAGSQEGYAVEGRGNKIQLCRFMEEGEICNKSLSNLLDGVLNNKDTFLKVSEGDIFQLKKHERAALLDMKSDQFYTDQSFQRKQKEKYLHILRRIAKAEKLPADSIPQNTLDELTELTAYVLNNVHYYQKFRIDDGLISPYDLLYVLEKVQE